MQRRNSNSELTKEALKRITGEFDLAGVITLNAQNLGIHNLDIIGECERLVYLNLSENRISCLTQLDSLKDLTSLDLSCNKISSLVGLEGVESLQTLDISGNLITSIDSLQPLVHLKYLRNLCLDDKERSLSNPICQTQPQYKKSVCKILTNISLLDGEKTVGEGAEVFQVCNALKEKLDDLEEKKFCGDDINETLENLDKKQSALLVDPTEKQVARSAERQFEDILQQCKNLNEEADKAISDAKQALWNQG